MLNSGATLVHHLRDDPILVRRLLNQSIQLLPETSSACTTSAGSPSTTDPAAIRAYRHALGLPNAPISRVDNLSQDLLLAGRFHDGWQTYEYS